MKDKVRFHYICRHCGKEVPYDVNLTGEDKGKMPFLAGIRVCPECYKKDRDA